MQHIWTSENLKQCLKTHVFVGPTINSRKLMFSVKKLKFVNTNTNKTSFKIKGKVK